MPQVDIVMFFAQNFYLNLLFIFFASILSLYYFSGYILKYQVINFYFIKKILENNVLNKNKFENIKTFFVNFFFFDNKSFIHFIKFESFFNFFFYYYELIILNFYFKSKIILKSKKN